MVVRSFASGDAKKFHPDEMQRNSRGKSTCTLRHPSGSILPGRPLRN